MFKNKRLRIVLKARIILFQNVAVVPKAQEPKLKNGKCTKFSHMTKVLFSKI